MALPNPFGSNPLPKPSFTAVASPKTFNPGPGLPHAIQPHYSPNIVAKTLTSDTKPKTFGFQRNNFQSSQYQPFSCDRCDRSFNTQDLLNHHISEHIPCGINGCPFVAHPKIVERHIQMQHDTGLAEQIMKLNTPEEIQKWREERKKRFPSSTNIALRQAEQKEKTERGEVLYEPKKKFAKGRNERGRGRGRGRGRVGTGWDARRNEQTKNNNQVGELDIHRNPQQVPSNSFPTIKEVKPLHTVLPSGQIKRELSDGELDSDNEVKTENRSTGSSNALANLMGYASESEESDTKKTKLVEESTTKVVETVHKERSSKRRKKGKAAKASGAIPTSKELIRPKRLTLLQKLLQGEILQERNKIMQCVHYIVQQNYFGFGQDPLKKVSTDAPVSPIIDSTV